MPAAQGGRIARRYPRAAGGLDNVATVLTDFGGRLDAERLATLRKAHVHE